MFILITVIFIQRRGRDVVRFMPQEEREIVVERQNVMMTYPNRISIYNYTYDNVAGANIAPENVGAQEKKETTITQSRK